MFFSSGSLVTWLSGRAIVDILLGFQLYQLTHCKDVTKSLCLSTSIFSSLMKKILYFKVVVWVNWEDRCKMLNTLLGIKLPLSVILLSSILASSFYGIAERGFEVS